MSFVCPKTTKSRELKKMVYNAKYKNIFWFLIDGLSPDFLRVCGNAEVQKNFFDELLERGTVFSNVATTAAGTHTSMHSIFSSSMPSVNGAAGWTTDALRNFDPEIFTLTDFLRMAGYHTYRYCDADKERTVPMSGFQVWESSGFRINDLLAKTDMSRTERRENFIKRVNSDKNNKFVYHHVELLHELNGRLGSVWRHGDYAQNIEKVSIEFRKLYSEYQITNQDLLIISSDHGVILDKDWHEDGIANGERHYEQSVKSFFALISEDIPDQVLEGLISSLDESPTLLKLVLDMDMPGQGLERTEYINNGSYKQQICLREKGTYNAPEELQNPFTSDVYYVRDGEWKYVYGIQDERCEWLINLKQDSDYEKNLKHKFPDLVKQYRQILNDEMISKEKSIGQIYDEHNFTLKKAALDKEFSVIVREEYLTSEFLCDLLDLAGPYYELIIIGTGESIGSKSKQDQRIVVLDNAHLDDLISTARGNWYVFLDKGGRCSEYLLSDLFCLINDGNISTKAVKFPGGLCVHKQAYHNAHGKVILPAQNSSRLMASCIQANHIRAIWEIEDKKNPRPFAGRVKNIARKCKNILLGNGGK